MSSLEVRAATANDLSAVIALERAVSEAPHWAERDYNDVLSGTGVRRGLFVVDGEDTLDGFAVGKVIGAGLAELESVAVRPGARRRGVGRALCDAVAAWCLEQGATTLELEVRAGSVEAAALYEDLGFVRVGLRRAYYRGPVEDAVLMRLRLA
jgi:ribosomal-protein-alanine N-acetyltransferase